MKLFRIYILLLVLTIMSCSEEDSNSEVTTIKSIACDICKENLLDPNKSISFKPAFSEQNLNFIIDEKPDFIKDLKIVAPKIKNSSKIVLSDTDGTIITFFDSLTDLERKDFNKEGEKVLYLYFLTFSGKINGLEPNEKITNIKGDILIYKKPVKINILSQKNALLKISIL